MAQSPCSKSPATGTNASPICSSTRAGTESFDSMSEGSLEEEASAQVTSGSVVQTTTASFDGAWADEKVCNICDVELGKRHLMPRHHCRACGASVCGQCSQGSIVFQGRNERSRICSQCSSSVERAPLERSMAEHLAQRLCSLAGTQDDVAEGPVSTVEQALGLCIRILEPLQKKYEKGVAEAKLCREASMLSEAKVDATQTSVFELAGRLRNISGMTLPAMSKHATIEDVLRYCDDAVAALEEDVARGSLNQLVPMSRESSPQHFIIHGDQSIPWSPRSSTISLSAGPADFDYGWSNRSPNRSLTHSLVDDRATRSMSTRDLRPTGLGRLRCACVRACRSSRTRHLLIGVAVGLALGIAAMASMRFYVAPLVGHASLGVMSLTLERTEVSGMSDAALDLHAQLTVGGNSIVSAHLDPFRATLRTLGGTDVATLYMPSLQIDASGHQLVSVRTQLSMLDAPGFREAAAQMFQSYSADQAGVWELVGTPMATVLGVKFPVHIRKSVRLPRMLLPEVQHAEMDIVSGTPHELLMSMNVTFERTASMGMVLACQEFGGTVFAIHMPASDGSLKPGVEIGTALMPSGTLEPCGGLDANTSATLLGRNPRLRDVSVVLKKMDRTLPSLQQVMGAWASGQQQVLIVRGPINTRSASVASVLTIPIPVMASPQGVRFDLARVNARRSLLGHQAQTGGACIPLSPDCLRGAVMSAPSASRRPMRLKNMRFQLELQQDLAYDVTLTQAGLPSGTLKCAAGTRLWDLEAAAGMWSYLDPSRFADQFVDLPGSNAGMSRALTTFFLRGVSPEGPPDPFTVCAANDQGADGSGEELRHLSCCLASRLTAAACYHRQRDSSFIPATSNGSQTLVVDGFEVHVKLPYRRLPIYFDDSMLTLWLGLSRASCRDFTFH